MRWDMHRPCSNCPFLRKGGIRVRRGRAVEIAEAVTSNPGAMFACHKTTVEVEQVDGSTDLADGGDSQHCAGALIFSDHLGVLGHTQMSRIAMRLRLLDPGKLEGRELVFDDMDEFLDAHKE